ncbi:MAG TPA: hypothetical protein VGQ42_02880 [Candidatus Dormibacteraeota bacterium]|jgi:hypothetical protein|nr:hypothetical protein [Candidatus Dormibacteraeota bacterium]
MPLVPSDPRARRILLAGCAGLLLTLPVLAHDSLNGRLLMGWLAVLAGVVLALVALDVRRVPGRLATLGCAAVLGATAASTVVLLISTVTDAPSSAALQCRDDVSAATFGAAAELRAGHNPYTSYDSLRVQQASGCAAPAATVLRQGSFAQSTAMPSEADVRAAVHAALRDPSRTEIERNLNYPGGSVLLGLVGPGAFPWVMAGLLVAAVVVTVRRSTSRLRPYVAVALAAQAALLSLIPDGHTDAAVVALLLLAWGSPTTVLGGLAMGLACGTKQTAWFLAPALLATAYARGGRPALMRSAGAAAVGFAALNLPFVVMGPSAWLHGVMGPMVDGLFPLGAGLIGLVTSGTLTVTLTPLFTALMVGCVVASVVAALRWDRTRPGIGVLLGGLALFLGPRSLLEYLAGAGVLLVCVVATAQQREASQEAGVRATSRRMQSTGYVAL